MTAGHLRTRGGQFAKATSALSFWFLGCTILNSRARHGRLRPDDERSEDEQEREPSYVSLFATCPSGRSGEVVALGGDERPSLRLRSSLPASRGAPLLASLLMRALSPCAKTRPFLAGPQHFGVEMHRNVLRALEETRNTGFVQAKAREEGKKYQCQPSPSVKGKIRWEHSSSPKHRTGRYRAARPPSLLARKSKITLSGSSLSIECDTALRSS